jgi:hypothetical protein
MKIFFTLPLILLGLASCSPSKAGFDLVNKNSMAFNQEGADFGECGIAGQFETGRATASQVAGGG